jgi:hypothetical protein
MVYDVKRDEGTVLRAVMSKVGPGMSIWCFEICEARRRSVDSKLRSSVRIWTELSTRGLRLQIAFIDENLADG